MNHLLKVIQFYKSVKENDKTAIEKLLNNLNVNYYNAPYKQIAVGNLIFNYYKELEDNNSCIYCFENEYQENIPFITLTLNKEYYYVKIAKNQILDHHFEINNLTHTSNDSNINVFKELVEIFPQFMFIYSKNTHDHYDVGLIGAPLLNQDATIHYNNTYLVDWYLTTFLIKEKDYNDLIDEYINITNKYNIINPTYLFYKRGNKFHLYIIIHNSSVSSFEAIGYISLTNITNTINKEYENMIIKLKSGKS